MTSSWVALAAFSACSIVFSCSSPSARETLGKEPSLVGFDQVVTGLGYACGSLDCHGSVTRNFRLYSRPGLRLAASDVPCGVPTTDAELLSDYRSAVGLEPELMSEVIESGGAQPGRLTLVRKARGAESHTGGSAFPEGSYGDQCLVSWLRGLVDVASCDNAHSGVTCIGD